MNVAIVGGGITGVSVGYFLAKQGVAVDIYEASPTLGGLAGQIELEDGTKVDRFYHAILSSDGSVQSLCDELGIADQLRFRETRTGFYDKGHIHSMNSTINFLRFPLLGWIDRFRLGLTVIRAQLIREWDHLENISVRDWLVRWGGTRTYETLWRPMLNAKFDGGFDKVPATWIWSRLVRMKSARGGANQKELVGHLVGGHITLIRAMEKFILKAGGSIHLNSPVHEIMIDDGVAWAIPNGEMAEIYDRVVCTLPAPIFERLIPDANPDYRSFLGRTEYLGVISALLVINEPLTGYWTLNLTDVGSPFTGVIETTTYIDPRYVGGHHLVYLPKYTAPASEWQTIPDQEIEQIWMKNLETMFPEFDRSSIQYMQVHRERYVEPLHRVNETELIPPVETPVAGLFLATTAQIYPGLTNAESLTEHARSATSVIMGEPQAVSSAWEVPQAANERHRVSLPIPRTEKVRADRERSPIASLSVDLDNQWSYMKTHGDPGWDAFPSYLDTVVPRILSMLEERDLKITFFVVGRDAAESKNDRALESIAAAGHEIGHHSFNHNPWLHLYTEADLEQEIDRAECAIERATGQRPIGFRGPGYSLSGTTLEILKRRGYRYDASTLPTFIGPLARTYYFANSDLTKEEKEKRAALFGSFKDGLRPLRPFRWSGERGAGLIEIPVTTLPIFRVPFHASYALYLASYSKRLASMYFGTALSMCKRMGVQPSLLLHPLDFMGSE